MKTAAAMLTAVKAYLLLCIPLLPAAVPAQGEGEPDPFCDKFKPVHTPVVGSGWTYRVVMAGLHKPRGLAFDSAGNLLVVEQGSAVRRLAFVGGGEGANDTCLALQQNTVVVRNENLTHGIALSNDGKTLFASTATEVLAWGYDAATAEVDGDGGGSPRVIVNGMNGEGGHSTRTLLMARKAPDTLLVSQGSGGNHDPRARDLGSGISQIRAFDLSAGLPDEPIRFSGSGSKSRLLGWGLRNSVGVAEDPSTGGIWSVENSVDDLYRDGADVHQDNPGEELNFHGFLATGGSEEDEDQATAGGNYGYPDCYAVWDNTTTGLDGLQVGDQFAPSSSSVTGDDACARDFVAPRLTWPAHTAPLDIKFAQDGSEAFISFHGSWDRDLPAGYTLSSVAFSDGEPEEPHTSTTSLRAVLSNADARRCPDACFRPAGLALDAVGRLYMSSDATGEIFVLAQAEVSANTGGDGGGGGGGEDGGGDQDSAAPAIVPRAYLSVRRGWEWQWGFGLTVLACCVTGLGLGLVAGPGIGRA